MLAALGNRISGFFRATAPDPFAIAVLLTALAFALVLIFTDSSPAETVAYWSDPSEGVWRFLGFAMQMCLILVTGHALASSPPARRALGALSSLPNTAPQAAALIAFVAAFLGSLNWGLGLIGGALLARDVGAALERRGVRFHYPLLAASGYVGLLVWHGGFSGTAPLKVTTERELADVLPAGLEIPPIPLTDTVLSPMNLVATGGLLLIAPLVMALLTPKARDEATPMSAFTAEPEPPAPSPADKPLIPRLLEDTPPSTSC